MCFPHPSSSERLSALFLPLKALFHASGTIWVPAPACKGTAGDTHLKSDSDSSTKVLWSTPPGNNPLSFRVYKRYNGDDLEDSPRPEDFGGKWILLYEHGRIENSSSLVGLQPSLLLSLSDLTWDLIQKESAEYRATSSVNKLLLSSCLIALYRSTVKSQGLAQVSEANSELAKEGKRSTRRGSLA
ncbi:hypothetical protein SDJN03_30354, partial [Cucurbita argyrosperma subsp. sororia]